MQIFGFEKPIAIMFQKLQVIHAAKLSVIFITQKND